jgi:putative tryptophan/tyrosine transport system substrate-binding protein
MFDLRRREFVTLLGGAAAWPLAAGAQEREKARRIGVLAPLTADDPESQVRNAGFLQGLADLGWRVGLNVEIEYRWAASDPEHIRQAAGELIALAPDVILATGTGALGALLQASRTVPVVFVNATDPVGGGFVASLAHPGGNATGFTMLEYGMSGKWLELLKQVSPHTTRAAVLRDPALASGSGQLGAIQAVAPFLGVEVSPIDVRDPGEIERGLTEFARGSNGGLIVTSGRFTFRHRALITMLAARHQLPAVYPYRSLVASGGLISFGPSSTDSFRSAAGYVARILKGEKAADLPVQQPTKFELVINLKTAKALGLDVPPTLLARADEVIE